MNSKFPFDAQRRGVIKRNRCDVTRDSRLFTRVKMSTMLIKSMRVHHRRRLSRT